MTRQTDVPATADKPTSLADRIGRGLLALCGIATLGAFANGISIMATVAPERLMSEAWRTFAYLVFAGLFVMLAVAPRTQRGAWELVFAHKIAITAFAIAAGDTPDANATWPIDLTLVLATAVAYVLCRGWYGWRSATLAPVQRRARRPAIV
ncbi:hypothetical protein DMA12_12990 [Amycolatopsis balhimycina DSM 5908]|uniref:Uncharacterized protein n=1 Tax=Amycolatopsis balhimycina DSM 5908 TaxID=1081091 RepID=A0A428WRX6_AMYBA|nr:hypothetical protein [Amycolatopsis balhimycina]RSM45783.1 hypothetical protein DMA12_12990 [Amycolatopsis balhimycina DSM 5908]